MIDVDKCTVRQTECVHFLQINGKHDIFVFIFHHYQGESQPTIAVKLWYEVILFASELVFFLPERAVRLYDFKFIFTCGKSNHRVTGIYIRFTCFVAQILSVFGTHDSKLNFHKILTLIS